MCPIVLSKNEIKNPFLRKNYSVGACKEIGFVPKIKSSHPNGYKTQRKIRKRPNKIRTR